MTKFILLLQINKIHVRLVQKILKISLTFKNFSVIKFRHKNKVGENMIKIGSRVCVSTKGICDIEDIRKNAFIGCDKNKEYYILRPVEATNNMVVYLPTDTKLKIRNLISEKQALQIYDNFENIEELKISPDDDKFGKINSIIQSGNADEVASLLKTLIVRKSKINKKQYSYQEQRVLTQAMNFLSGEISVVLKKEKQEVENKFLKII